MHSQTNWILSPAIRRQAEPLYTQQMWVLGQDVRYPEGNLLLDYGFQKQRFVPLGQGGSSQYTLILPDATLNLWSFGFTLSYQEHSLLLKRYTFRPRLLKKALPQKIWKSIQLPPSRVPQQSDAENVSKMLAMCCEFFGQYEAWLQQRMPANYRAQCIQRWPKRAVMNAEQMSPTWLDLAQMLS